MNLLFFEEVLGSPNTYDFHTTAGAAPFMPGFYPPSGVCVTFRNHEPEGRSTVSAAVEATCGVLEMAGAADYVQCVLDDLSTMERQGTLAGNGSSGVEMLFRLKGLGGWSGYQDEATGRELVVENQWEIHMNYCSITFIDIPVTKTNSVIDMYSEHLPCHRTRDFRPQHRGCTENVDQIGSLRL